MTPPPDPPPRRRSVPTMPANTLRRRAKHQPFNLPAADEGGEGENVVGLPKNLWGALSAHTFTLELQRVRNRNGGRRQV